MTRARAQKRRRSRESSRRYDPHDPRHDAPDVGDTLSSILECLLHVLACQTCESCVGTGMKPDGVGEGGKPRFVRCECRRLGREFVEEFEP